jgi:hypothetical protein
MTQRAVCDVMPRLARLEEHEREIAAQAEATGDASRNSPRSCGPGASPERTARHLPPSHNRSASRAKVTAAGSARASR